MSAARKLKPENVILAALNGDDVSPEDLGAALAAAGAIGAPVAKPPRKGTKGRRPKPLTVDLPPDVVQVANIGARTFKRPGPRIINAKTGAVVPPEKLAMALVEAAVLEHARADAKGKGGALRMCEGCGKPMAVPPRNHPKKWCHECAKRKRCEWTRAYAARNPEKKRASNRKRMSNSKEAVRATQRAWCVANSEKLRAALRARRAANPEKNREYCRAYKARKKAEREAAAKEPTS